MRLGALSGLICLGLRECVKNVLKTRQQKILWGAVAIFGLLCGTFLLLAYFAEPRYGGRTLTDWLLEYHVRAYGDHPREAAEAEKAIRAIGTNAIPTLVRLLFPMARGLPVARMLEAAQIPVDFVEDDSARISYHVIALNGFHLLGPAASNALPQLLPHLNDPERARYVTSAIEFIGAPAVGPVAEYLASTNIAAKQRAVRILFSIRGRELSTFSNLFVHPDPIVRGEGYLYLVASQVPSDVQSALLTKGLNDPEAHVVSRAAIAVRNPGTDGTNFLPQLYELSTSTNAHVAAEVRSSIQSIEKRVRIKSSPRIPRP